MDIFTIKGYFTKPVRALSTYLLAFVLVCLHVPVHASSTTPELNVEKEDPKAWVNSMSKQAKSLSFKGFFTYERGFQSTSYEYIHQSIESDGAYSERQRLVFLDGEPQEIVNDQGDIKFLNIKAKQSHSLSRSEAQKIFNVRKDFTHVWELYSARFLEDSRMAGRYVKRIYLKPKDEYRYAYLFAVDQQTGLMLKMMVLTQEGKVLERLRYVTIEYGDVEDEDIFSSGESFELVERKLHRIENPANAGAALLAERSVAEVDISMGWLPAGFMQNVSSESEKKQTSIKTFSDGLSSFSVIVEDVTENSSLSENGFSWENGGTSIATRHVSLDGKPYSLTVIGELPLSAITKIAESLSLKQG